MATLKKWTFPTTIAGANNSQNGTIQAAKTATEKVSAQTAKQPTQAENKQETYIPAQAPKKYKPSQTVKAYESQYNTMKTQAPVYDNAARKAQVDELLNKALNMGKFEYNALQDPIYQQYAREYTRLGKMAMEDTQGQAAALSGGFGNSYGATAGAQQYNQYMQQLANIIPELEDRAYNRHLNDQDQAWKAYSAMSDAEAQDYARYLNELQQHNVQLDRAQQDWLNAYAQEYQLSRDAAADRQWYDQFNRGIYESDRAYDYQLGRDAVADQQWRDQFNRNVYENDRNYQYQLGRDAVSDDQWRRQFERGNYEYDQSMAWAREQYDRNLALQQAANERSAQSAAAELAYKQYRDQIADQQWAAEQAEKQRQFNKQWGLDENGNPVSGTDTDNTGNDTLMRNPATGETMSQKVSDIYGRIVMSTPGNVTGNEAKEYQIEKVQKIADQLTDDELYELLVALRLTDYAGNQTKSVPLAGKQNRLKNNYYDSLTDSTIW